MDTIPTGCKELDELLDGGYEKDIITTIYGPSGSGKTNLVLMAAVEIAKSGKKVIFIDTEGGFSVSRLKQISGGIDDINDNFLFLRPISFDEQRKSFEKLKELVNDDIGLIVVDTIVMLYRIELGKKETVFETNRELGGQISRLTEIARKKKIPVLLTNQVYAGFDKKEEIRMVGGDIIKYGSKCIIVLRKEDDNYRTLVLQKHRSIKEGKTLKFNIVEKGMEVSKGNLSQKDNPSSPQQARHNPYPKG